MFKKYNEEENKLVWKTWIILLVEMLGTFALVFEIIAPSSFNLFDKTSSNEMIKILGYVFDTFLMKAFWVAGFIWILIILLRNISVNLNPAVTLSEIIKGHDSIELGCSKIFVQFIGAFAASFSAYYIAVVVGTWHDGSSSLDGVQPVLNFGHLNNVFNFNEYSFSIDGSHMSLAQLGYSLIPFILEFLYTFILIISIFWGKNITKNGRAFIIFAAVQLVVTLGVATHNIALNPARLIAPSIIATVYGGASTSQYIIIFLSGELLAVVVFWLIENKNKKILGDTISEVKKQYRIVFGEMLAYRARHEWVLDGNKSLHKMTKEELLIASDKLKIETSKNITRDELEYNILENLIFKLEKIERNKLKKIVNKSKKISSNKKSEFIKKIKNINENIVEKLKIENLKLNFKNMIQNQKNKKNQNQKNNKSKKKTTSSNKNKNN